jgi:phenylacetate-CoA ligase
MQNTTYDLSVVGSAYNEGNNIIELVERLEKVFDRKKVRGEIVLVNDRSTDDTGEIMNVLAKKYQNLKIIHNEKNLKIARSWEVGISIAHGTYVCLMDTDLQNLPEDVYNLYREITFTNADLVQGWRNHIGKTKHTPQYFLSRGLNFLLNLLFDMHAQDNKSGFVIARKDVLLDVMKHKFAYTHFQTFITVAAHARGYTIREIETLFAERALGQSYMSGKLLKTTWDTFIDVCKGFIEYRILDLYDPSVRKHVEGKRVKKTSKAMHGWRYRIFHTLFPLHHWIISYNATKYLEDLKQSEWLSLEDTREYQNAKLRQLISHAYYHVPYYREVMEERNIKSTDIQTIEDLQKLPIINKAIVRENLHMGMLSNNHDKRHLLKVTTSGSTGEPFTIYAEKKQLEMRWAATLRSTEWTGYRFGDRQVRLWHKNLGMKPIEVLKERLDAFFTRRKFIPAYEISEENIGSFLSDIMSYKPVLLDGYAESYNIIAQKLGTGTYEGHKPKGIMSSGQTLPPQSRDRIEKAFGCRVFDKYGAREFAGGLAYQCEKQRDNYHIVAECSIIEIVDSEGKPVKPGEMGSVVVTELNNYACPLIRYQLGDFAIAVDPAMQCECGRGLPLMGPVQGRIQATILGANNQLIPGTFFARLFADYDYAIRQFQVVQTELGKITLRLVKANRYTDSVLEKVMEEIRKHLSDTIDVRVDFVDVIPLGKTGKRHHSVSMLDLDTVLFKK